MKPQRDEEGHVSVSFLDVIACAFGAIVLLILILPIGEDALTDTETLQSESSGRILLITDQVQEEIQRLRQEIRANTALLVNIESESLTVSDATQQISEILQTTNSQINQVKAQTASLEKTRSIISRPRPEVEVPDTLVTEVSGIPVDSEYLAFVIDTSGSMQTIWEEVMDEIERFWLLYPKLKGFQIVNDNGHYLYGYTKKRWMPDSESARKRALVRLDSWFSFSNSSPVEGITKVIDDLYRDGIKMAVVVVGDDYQGVSFQSFLDRIEANVTANSVGDESLRIHALGFSNFSVGNADKFGILMRALTNQYNGAFVALEQRYQSPIPWLR